jgi:hypothetical protein
MSDLELSEELVEENVCKTGMSPSLRESQFTKGFRFTAGAGPAEGIGVETSGEAGSALDGGCEKETLSFPSMPSSLLGSEPASDSPSASSSE